MQEESETCEDNTRLFGARDTEADSVDVNGQRVKAGHGHVGTDWQHSYNGDAHSFKAEDRVVS